MTFEINGVDIVPYIFREGLKWQRSDIDGENAGRLLSGEMQRDRIATKIRWDVTCKPLKSNDLSMILQLIEPEFVRLTYSDPVTNSISSGQFYSNNFPVSFLIVRRDGTEWWNGLTFPLIEK